MRTALVLAAHGSAYQPSVNEAVRSLALDAGRRLCFDEAVAAFHHGEPRFAEVLGNLHGATIVVVPLMAAAGYYSGVVLPRELRKNARYAEAEITVTKPVGTHPGMVRVAAKRLNRMIRRMDAEASRTSAIVVGHGTSRHAQSHGSTEHLARKLVDQGRCAQAVTAYLDDHPPLETAVRRTTQPFVVVLPFLLGAGAHAIRDIPCRLGIARSASSALPRSVESSSRRIIVDRPLGIDPDVANVVIDLARSAMRRRHAAISPEAPPFDDRLAMRESWQEDMA